MVTQDQISYGLEVIDAPDEEPVTSAEAIEHLRESTEYAQTAIVAAMIVAARQWCEEYLHRALITTQYTLFLDGFGDAYGEIWLPRSQVISVDAVRYLDSEGSQQTLATSLYRSDIKTLIGRIQPAYSQCWPSTYPVNNAVEIDFTAGYGADAASVPEPIKLAIKFLVAHWYDNRHPVVVGSVAQDVPVTVTQLLAPYRVRS